MNQHLTASDQEPAQPGHGLSLTQGWELTPTAAGLAATPGQVPADAAWIPASVPGTAARALQRAGQWEFDNTESLRDRDVWYRTTLPGLGRRVLCFEGLATRSEAWLDGRRIMENDSMFQPCSIDVNLPRPLMMHLCFRSLPATLQTMPRAPGRWRAPMIPDRRLRWLRTTLLGHMPGWCPPVNATGPYRAVRLLDPDGPPPPGRIVLRACPHAEGGQVFARVVWRARAAAVRLRVGGAEAALHEAAPGLLAGELIVPGARPWWPATHGVPHLYPASLLWDGTHVALPPVGFRDVCIDRGDDGQGFGLRVNGVPLFCRGAVWASADPVGLAGDEAACRPWLEAARDAGMNLIRVPATTLYEDDGFYAVCDRLGLLVWQDVAFANLDYPAEPAFLSSVEAEMRAFLERTSGRACLAVLCGGSEVAQQAAMLGLPKAAWDTNPIFNGLLPRLCAELRPDVPYIPHTPDGPDLPFRADAAPAHYFGAGAYRRPPEDARLAGVRFAAECLALANVPCAATLDEAPALSPTQAARWKARIPRDLGAAWDFEDVRDHYLETLFGQDARRLRGEQPARYLTLSRAVSAVLMADVFAQWRRAGSACKGGLVLALQDMWPGAGWGVLDSLGRPKSAWHALRGVLASVQVLLLDDGLNGVQVHLANDTAELVAGQLELAWYRNGQLAAAPAIRAVQTPPRRTSVQSAAELIGGFRDLAHTYRFGPPIADAVRARLIGEDGTSVSEHWLFPGRLLPSTPLGLCVELDGTGPDWRLHLHTDRVAQGVHVQDPAWRAESEWFNLAPGEPRSVRLIPLRAGEQRAPEGEVVALNALSAVPYSGRGTILATDDGSRPSR